MLFSGHSTFIANDNIEALSTEFELALEMGWLDGFMENGFEVGDFVTK
jgi:hypothetical protein